MQGFYGGGIHNNMLMRAFQGQPLPSMVPNLTGISPNIQPTNQMDAYKQQMMWLTSFGGLQNPMLSVTSPNPMLPDATKTIFPSFETDAAGGRLFGGSNVLKRNTNGFTPLAHANHLATMTSSGIFPTSGKIPVFPSMTQSVVNKNSFSQSLSSSPASSNDSSGSPDYGFPINAPSNLFPVPMQKYNKMKLAEMMQKYQRVQAVSRSFQSRSPNSWDNSDFPNNATLPSNMDFNPMLFNSYFASNKDFLKSSY